MHSLIVAWVAYNVQSFLLFSRQGVKTMDMIETVRNRILTLCGEHEITINKLADLAGLPPSSVKNILYGKSRNPKLATIKMLWPGHDLGRVFLHRGI